MKAERQKDLAGLTSFIKEEAQRLGFALVGVSPVKAPPHEESFAEWLRNGFGGELAYMKRTEGLRRVPAKVTLKKGDILLLSFFPWPPYRPQACFKPELLRCASNPIG